MLYGLFGVMYGTSARRPAWRQKSQHIKVLCDHTALAGGYKVSGEVQGVRGGYKVRFYYSRWIMLISLMNLESGPVGPVSPWFRTSRRVNTGLLKARSLR